MSLYISPPELHDALLDGDELALIDVREQGVFGASHIFWAVCIPRSRFELRILDLVPRPGTRIVLCDDGSEEDAIWAMETLDTLGYDNVRILDGGTEAWAEAGYELYSGVNVPSKAFGEFVEHTYDTPRLAPQELEALRRSGRDLVILDSRPAEEYRRMNIPGGIDVPGAELVYRIAELAPDPETLVVVNCAGRTRSIIGAQSLINAGIPNEVAALKDGTMGWELAGLACERGADRSGPEPSPPAVAQAQGRAAAVARRFGVPFADKATIEGWQAEADDRTLYLLDVRTAEEFVAGHVAGTRHAPGGQLVQATDEYVATRHARIVLFDSERVRAVMTASWLIQLGWGDVHVHDGAIADWPVETGPRPPAAPEIEEWETVGPDEIELYDVEEMTDDDNQMVLDMSDSLTYRRNHIPQAFWGVRGRIGEDDLPYKGQVVVYADDDRMAHLTAAELERLETKNHIVVFPGGLDAWRAAGGAVEPDSGNMFCALSETNDVWYKPYDTGDDPRARMEEYLAWEVALVEQIARDDTVSFRKYP